MILLFCECITFNKSSEIVAIIIFSLNLTIASTIFGGYLSYVQESAENNTVVDKVQNGNKDNIEGKR